MAATVRILGIRHHGPGSARSVVAALEDFAPDAVLVEGPPDAQSILDLAGQPGFEPPVALLVFAADDPRRASFFPFATFSPEWQALRFGLARGCPVRFIDLPMAYQLATERPERADTPNDDDVRDDPLGYLARIAGDPDGERWWDHVVESRTGASGEVFDAVLDAMAELRAHAPEPDVDELRREAHMRQAIRAAQREGFARIAVVCGAWHAPALAQLPSAASDAALLKGRPTVKTKAAWVPWTYERLAAVSGYGAGVASPEWYHLLWESEDAPVLRWMTRMARLLRADGLDASSAHVIEAVRLADALAALRGRSLPGLDEVLDAAQAVVCVGATAPLRLIERKLVFGERLGRLPIGLPLAPLQEDLARAQRRLRLPSSAEERTMDLDLRNDTDLARSHLFPRLRLLDVPWAEPATSAVRAAGTFHEHWHMRWRPELEVALIDAARWGGTIEEAATGAVLDRVSRATDVAAIADALERVLLGALTEAVEPVVLALEARTALQRDVGQLMDALTPLVRSRRYGSVRRTDGAALDRILSGIVTRIHIGLASACASLDDDAAAAMAARLTAVEAALVVLADDEARRDWHSALDRLADHVGLHALVAGRAARLLHDAGAAPPSATAIRMGLAVSAAHGPAATARWVEGFASGGGVRIVHDDALWALLDGWLTGLDAERFVEVLPLLRRTFATFAPAERRQIGERARRGMRSLSGVQPGDGIVGERAARVVPVLRMILGTDEEQ